MCPPPSTSRCGTHRRVIRISAITFVSITLALVLGARRPHRVAAEGEARVVEEDVDPAERVDDLGDEPLARGGVGHVESERELRLEALDPTRAAGDARAFRGESAGGLRADPARRAGDDRPLAFECAHGGTLVELGHEPVDRNRASNVRQMQPPPPAPRRNARLVVVGGALLALLGAGRVREPIRVRRPLGAARLRRTGSPTGRSASSSSSSSLAIPADDLRLPLLRPRVRPRASGQQLRVSASLQQPRRASRSCCSRSRSSSTSAATTRAASTQSSGLAEASRRRTACAARATTHQSPGVQVAGCRSSAARSGSRSWPPGTSARRRLAASRRPLGRSMTTLAADVAGSDRRGDRRSRGRAGRPPRGDRRLRADGGRARPPRPAPGRRARRRSSTSGACCSA